MALVILDHRSEAPYKKKKSSRPLLTGVFPLPYIDRLEEFSPFTFNSLTPRIWKSLSNAARIAKYWSFRRCVTPQTALVDVLWPGLG